MLDPTLAEVRKRIARAGSKGLNEPNTQSTMIEPAMGRSAGAERGGARPNRLK